MIDVDALKIELSVHALRCGPRVRLAVTAEEFEALRQSALASDSIWWSRIRNLPLIIEADPANPALAFELPLVDPLTNQHAPWRSWP